MRIEFLEYILVVSKTTSISRAAKKLYVKQTTLSAAIRSVEDELGFSIFQRHATGITLTDQGRALLPLAQHVLDAYDQMKQLAPLPTQEENHIRMLIHPRACASYSMPIMRTFRTKSPNSSLSIIEESESDIPYHLLENRTTHIGVCGVAEEAHKQYMQELRSRGLKCEPLCMTTTMLYVSAKSKFAGRSAVDVQELKDEHLALSQHGCTHYFRTKTNKIISKHSVFSNSHLVWQAVLENDMITFFADSNTNDGFHDSILQNSLVKIPLTGIMDLESERNILIYSACRLSAAENTLLDVIREVFLI